MKVLRRVVQESMKTLGKSMVVRYLEGGRVAKPMTERVRCRRRSTDGTVVLGFTSRNSGVSRSELRSHAGESEREKDI